MVQNWPKTDPEMDQNGPEMDPVEATVVPVEATVVPVEATVGMQCEDGPGPIPRVAPTDRPTTTPGTHHCCHHAVHAVTVRCTARHRFTRLLLVTVRDLTYRFWSKLTPLLTPLLTPQLTSSKSVFYSLHFRQNPYSRQRGNTFCTISLKSEEMTLFD